MKRARASSTDPAMALRARLQKKGRPMEQAGYVVKKDPRVARIQGNLINRWQQQYIEGRAEGRSGEEQKSRLHGGPRKIIRAFNTPLRFKGTNSTQVKRSTLTEKMIEAGDSENALNRVRLRLMRSNPRLAYGRNMMSDTSSALALQRGLAEHAKASAGSSKSYFDATML